METELHTETGITVDITSLKVALVGNPNSGKSTLFNSLTGLNQRTGNFPGVTVDKKTGIAKLATTSGKSITAEFIDLPGTYSLYPKSLDERVAFEVLCDPANEDHPGVTVVVADASNLKRNLFLVTQIIDLQLPVVLALNMMDLVEKAGMTIDTALLSERLGVPVIPVNARKKEGIAELKKAIASAPKPSPRVFINSIALSVQLLDEIKSLSGVSVNYAAFQVANNHGMMSYFDERKEKREHLESILSNAGFDAKKVQALESVGRFKIINKLVEECVSVKEEPAKDSLTSKLDKVLTHRVWGYAIFLGILFLIFQTIFSLAAYPMEWIELLFVKISQWGNSTLPPGALTDLLVNGILSGLSGIVVFVPQIAMLFFFIGVLEDSGYMARVSFIMDKLMRKFGLNGKSVIPLISGVACAVPAIMGTRTISNWKERMITIMVTPLMSCSARLPVYTLLISLVIPEEKSLGIFNLQGLLLMGLYLIGFVAALASAWVMKFILRAKEKSYFIMEMPVYRLPNWPSLGLTILDKVKVFLIDAGKVIIAISIILWALSSYGPGNKMEQIEKNIAEAKPVDLAEKGSLERVVAVNTIDNSVMQIKEGDIESFEASQKLEASYAGQIGKFIEPAIAPLGFDWKIGISLVTSFAAREVFVGTMATIYSSGDEEDTRSIREKMTAEVNPSTGEKIYTAATGFSLLIFYAFAMQCMSTLAIVYRETKNWKWPMIQFLYMSALAWVSSFVVYSLFK